ncbi:hypothetical protein ADL22_19765 [Streptomyces sp. NRRL F-4489]|uniref:hypothetical protein n=1 Tax=Streptomyces sp. NRRL F-4489 TaxID=1609095 RepID=UPI00074A71EC|nr:hypothetical protein [Streptomyces sp. NRRL F-4489]KUL37878.1 hypothetical protein ADL22_19765 [Streptomyces sp. NRRL F-4489]
MQHNDRLEAPDAPAFEHALDQALRSPEIRAALRRAAGSPDAGQLRGAALAARDALAAAASAEYREVVRLRAAAAEGPSAVPPPDPGTASRSGGVLPALGVLVPALAATAAVVFLLIGFGLRAVAGASRLAGELVTAGWTSAVVAGVATLTGLGWLLVAASRNRAAAGAGAPADASPAVARALAVWQLALLERGIMPFLLGRLEGATDERDGGGDLGARPAYPRAALPRPALPGSASAGAAGTAGTTGTAGTAKADAASRDADGPAQGRTDSGGADVSRPDFGTPDFSSPDFGSPGFGRPGFSGPTAPGAP